ncbi:MAG: ATP-binding protein [Chloroflexia bacterium]
MRRGNGHGALVLVGRCYDLSETPPYGPWRELFDRAPRGEALPTLPAAVLPSERDGEVLTSQEAIVRRCLFHFAALATARPVAVLLDDVHWADPASLDLLRRRAGTSRTCRCSFSPRTAPDEASPTSRSTPCCPPWCARPAPSALTFSPGRGGDRHARRGAMRRPTRTATASWATSSGAPRGTRSSWASCCGPWRAREFCAMRATVGHWATVGVPAPSLLRQVIAGRLARLGDEDRRLLAVAAILGQEPAFDSWAGGRG